MLTLALGKIAVDLLQTRQTLRRIALGACLSLVGSLAALIHLQLFDRLFLALGRVKVK